MKGGYFISKRILLIFTFILNSLICQEGISQLNANAIHTISITKCGISNCKPDNGLCYLDKCYCCQGFTTIKGSDIYCNYKMKSHLVAMMLEFFFPFGVGHLYVENYLIGSFKLVYFILLIVSLFLFYRFLKRDFNSIAKHKLAFLLVSYLLCSALYILWSFVDIMLFGLNIYTDGNNINLE